MRNASMYMKRVISKIGEKGIAHYMNILFRIFFKIIKPKYGRLFVFELDLAQLPQRSKQKGDVRVEVIKSIEEIASFVKEREKWYYEYAKDLFEKGNLCFVGKADNKIVSCVWTSFHEVYLPDVEYVLHVGDNIVPLIDAYTLPAYRGMGIYKIVWNECIEYFQNSHKFSRIYGFIVPSNTRSLTVHKNLKLERIIMTITLLRIFGIRKHFVKNCERML